MEGGGCCRYCESGCVVLQGRRRTWFVSCSSGFGWDSSLYRLELYICNSIVLECYFARYFICWYIGTVEMHKIGFRDKRL